jgi:hypothetical protein
MHRARPALVVAVAAAILLSTTGVAQAEPTLTYSKLAAMTPKDQAAILDPLRAVASAAGAIGRGAESEVFSGVKIDAPNRTVTIYLTELNRQPDFLAAMQQQNPKVNSSPARFKQGAYPMTTLIAAANEIARQERLNKFIESIAVQPDGSALTVRAYNVGRAEAALSSPMLSAAVGSVAVGFEKTAPSDLVAF